MIPTSRYTYHDSEHFEHSLADVERERKDSGSNNGTVNCTELIEL